MKLGRKESFMKGVFWETKTCGKRTFCALKINAGEEI